MFLVKTNVMVNKMEKDEEKALVQITTKNQERIKAIGGFGETYDMVITRILDEYEKINK
jgi:thiamine pyrophosphokinase